MSVHRMLLISTGGTIAGEVASTKKDAGYEIAKADAFSDIIKDTLSYLRRTTDIEVQIQPEEFSEIDSSEIKPKHWEGLIDRIYENYDDYDSFVITHGTNTMGYTAAALSFGIRNPSKPIIMTGSQVPINQPGSDAKTNLENAIRLATWKKEEKRIQGVVCVFGSHIITGTRVKKDTEFDYDAFKSFHSNSIGRIGRIININSANLDAHNARLETAYYHRASKKAQLVCENAFDPNICSFTEFPGMNYELLTNLHKNNNIGGFIVRAFGAGDMSGDSLDVLRFLRDREVPVVVTTQAPNGNANLQVNEPGQKLMEEKLVIPAHDMSIESQTTKLMWLLAKKKSNAIDFSTLRKEMIADMKGEINVIWEVD